MTVPSATAAIQMPKGTRTSHDKNEARAVMRSRRAFWLLAGPAALGLLVTYVLPLIYMVRMAFNRGESNGLVEQTFTLDTLIEPLTDPYYWKVTLDTFLMGVSVAVLCILVSYPIALFLARTSSKWKNFLIVLAIAPLLTSAVVRTYGWMIILGSQGVVNSGLMGLGIIQDPLRLTNNMTGVIIGLVEIFMPYAILAMLTGFGRLSDQLEEAARSLGANRFKVFGLVTLPLSLPGVLSAFLLTFVLTVSTFITPRLLGGGVVKVLATEIYDQATGLINWPFAAALSVILVVLFGVVVGIYQLIVKKLGGTA